MADTDFKLCGFLPLVVAVLNPPPPLPSKLDSSGHGPPPISSSSNEDARSRTLLADSAVRSEDWQLQVGRDDAAQHAVCMERGNKEPSCPELRCCNDAQRGSECAVPKARQENSQRFENVASTKASAAKYDFTFENVFYSRRKQSASNHTRGRGSACNPPSDPLERLIGAEYWLAGEGPEVQFHASGGFLLSPTVSVAGCMGSLGEDLSSPLDDTNMPCEWEHTPVALSKSLSAEAGCRSAQKQSSSKKRKKLGFNGGGYQILNNLQVLTVRNGVRLKARAVRAARKGTGEVRAVVLIDLYLPSFLWSGRNYWKPSPAFTSVINHLSCDWESRRMLLEYDGRKLDDETVVEIWNTGECQVLGCGLHYVSPEAMKQTKFDMHAIFKSLPSLKGEKVFNTIISPEDDQASTLQGIWDVPNEVLMSILSRLSPRDLRSVAATCRHMRELALYVMPCMNLKLFPHQQAAVCWMLQRELYPATLTHPLYKDLQTEDGFHFYLNCLSGDLSPEAPPCITDFRGGLFCDEPGLGKTVTAICLILKTQGTLATPPDGIHVNWCEHRSGDRYGYYDIASYRVTSVLKRCMDLKAKHNKVDGSSHLSNPSSHHLTQSMPAGKRRRDFTCAIFQSSRPIRHRISESGPTTRASTGVKRKLLEAYEGLVVDGSADGSSVMIREKREHRSGTAASNAARLKNYQIVEDIWVQCDSCSKWRKIAKEPDEGLAWFCNMNKDPLYQSCSDPEERWESGPISSFPGFHKAGGASCLEQNVIHFANVLKECASLRDAETNAVLTWLANLSPDKLAQMSKTGVSVPSSLHVFNQYAAEQHHYRIIFQRFGLVPKIEGKGVKKWCYPPLLDSLVFDLPALRDALNKPSDAVRLYLSRATLIVVPPNLVEHWRNQIIRHTKPDQLRICVLIDQKNAPKVQDLAWNFDIVITTFSRLSCEWAYKDSSVLMGVHRLRVVLDEGHTLGASLSLTNKLQMAMSMHASRRWVLTGTPTPHTPNSQVAHLHPMLKFLHEEVYGKSQKSWEGGVLKPFESGSEEGRVRLLELLQRCMISARKSDLCMIPPCSRKITLIDFTQKHAESYNELVATVRRNILMADWNDPSHVESLLNPKQWKFRSNTIRNVRLSCCVAGHIKVENAGEDIQETMEILAQEGMDPLSWEYAVIKNALLVGGNCNRCDEWCRLPIITPCKHLLCLDCVALDRQKCTLPGCGNPYKMQSPEDLTRPENPNPKWPVPQDLIELQPSYVQDNWDPDWQATSSSKVAYLVDKLKELKGMTLDSEQLIDGRELSDTDFGQQKAEAIVQKDPPEKAIVFSQFLEHIHVIERQLAKAGIKVAGMYSPMHSVNKMKSLISFQNEEDCTVLLMDGSAALGLDLSFVTHVFLMEPIWDRSMEEQVVSRAHRMGATRPILVETLAMRGTIEEQMLQFLQDPEEHSRAVQQDFQTLESGRSSLKTVHDFAESSYLARLSFIRTKNGA